MKNKKILLVEDNIDDQEFISRLLKESDVDHELVIVNDGAQALEYLFATGRYEERDVNDQPRVVMLDLKLPKINGLEVLEKLRADPRTAVTPVVVFSSSNEEEDIIASYRLGANSYIRKSVDFNSFTETVKSLGTYWLLLNHGP